MVVCWLPHTGRAGRLGRSHCKFAGCCSPSPSSPPPSTGSWRTCGSSWWSCGWVGDPGGKEEEVLGPTILQAGGLPAAATLSGSSFPSPGRAGQLRRRGRIQNHRSEINIGVRNVMMTMIFVTVMIIEQGLKSRRTGFWVAQEVYPVLETPRSPIVLQETEQR